VREFACEPLIRRLIDWGIETVFGRAGDGPDGVAAAFERHRDRIRLLPVEHEEAAGFMACGHAKATGGIGVCIATSGPGAIHLMNGLYDAKLDHQPVLAITESQRTSLLGTGFDQELRLDEVLRDVADYNARVHVPVQIPAMVDIGIGNAIARGSVSHITFPSSLEPAEDGSAAWMVSSPSVPPTAPVFTSPPGLPNAVELEHAAALLNRGRRVAMLVGVGGTGAMNELLAVAEVLGSPIVKSLPGKAVVRDDHPLTTGCAGALGSEPSREVLATADTVLVVGSNYPYLADAADPRAVRAVHLDTDAARISGRAGDVVLVGEPGETLQALLPMLDRRQDRAFLQQARAGVAAWRERLAATERGDDDGITPGFLVRTVDRLAADDAVLCSDSGAMAVWSARHFDVRADRDYLVSANLAAMAAGLPYAAAAQHAHPGRQCIAMVSAESFIGLMGELLTLVGQRLPVKVMVAAESPGPDLASWADACGALGLRVASAPDLEGAVELAIGHDGPALVDVLVSSLWIPPPAGVATA
jgi:thiamine pyrophosphate-dependent acetolactate synthase large subunit-like protein